MATNEQWRQRRRVVQALGAAGGLGAVGERSWPGRQAGKIKVGFMLPYTGTYAALGRAIENGFKLYVSEQGGKLGGRETRVLHRRRRVGAARRRRTTSTSSSSATTSTSSSAPSIPACRWRS